MPSGTASSGTTQASTSECRLAVATPGPRSTRLSEEAAADHLHQPAERHSDQADGCQHRDGKQPRVRSAVAPQADQLPKTLT